MSAATLSPHPLRARAARGQPGGRSARWLIAALLALLLTQQVAVLHRLGHALLLLPDAGALAVALASPGAASTADPADGQGAPGTESATCLDCLAIGDLGATPPPIWQTLPPAALTEVLAAGPLLRLAGAAIWHAQARGPPAV
jgi:hypothetical protein